MHQFKNILAYVHLERDSQRGLARAVEQARANQARLTVAGSVEAAPSLRQKLLGGDIEKLYARHVAQAEQALQELVAPLQDLGVATRTLVGEGWLELIREAIRGEYDLLVKEIAASDRDATPAFRPDRHFDMPVLRKCPCPVWLVKQQVTSFKRIAAAVEIDALDERQQRLNRKILQLARSLAEIEGCELHVVHAWTLAGETLLRRNVAADKLEQLRSATRSEVAGELEQLVAEYSADWPKTFAHLVEGPPESVIPEFVKREHEDLLVMGTVGRGGLAGLITGNTAEKVLERIDCSVLAVKPDGFVSPIRP